MIENIGAKAYLLAVHLAQAQGPGQTPTPPTGQGQQFTQPGIVQIPGNLPKGELAPVIATVINWGLSMAGGVAVLMLIVGGFTYITAAGDERRIERGKAIVRSAITGIIIILISAIIVNTIYSALF